MKKSDLLKRLEDILANENSLAKAFITGGMIERLINDVNKATIKNGKYKSNFKFIHIRSQKGMILNYMQKNSGKSVTGSDFMKKSFFSKAPFVGYCAGVRLSDLLRAGLIEKDGYVKGIKKFLHKSKDRTLYTISIKGLKYKLKGQ